AGFPAGRLFVSGYGVQVGDARAVPANKILTDSLSITEVLNQSPNTAAFTSVGFEATQGQDVIITRGSINAIDRVYAGTILNRTHRYIGTPANWYSDVNVIDYTWLLTRRTFSGAFTNVSASVIGAAIVAVVPGVTSGILPGLPTIDSIS